MKKYILHILFIYVCLSFLPIDGIAQSSTEKLDPLYEQLIAQHDDADTNQHSDEPAHPDPDASHDHNHDDHNHGTDDGHGHDHGDEHGEEHAGDHGHGKSPPFWSVIPFALLLILIAVGPIFFEHFWHHNYKVIAPVLGAIVLLYYLFGLGNTHAPIHSAAEYFSFIALLAPLYIASGGILIRADIKGTPLANIALLFFGAAISNVIGTTGASMLLIRPFISLNRDRLEPYHIVFFIFIVSNVGGALTPIGDPPLFLGFLKGVPFFWTLQHVVFEWIFALALLAAIFYVIDSRNKKDLDRVETYYSGRFLLVGQRNFLWLAIIIGAVFLDPNVLPWVPAIEYDGMKFSFLREIIQLTAGFMSFRYADKRAHKHNTFTFEPIYEVVFLFLGIFFTMMPALQLIGEFAASPTGADFFTLDRTFWATGILSGFLDNAPTYLNFLAASCSKFHLDIASMADVQAFAAGSAALETKDYLRAISVSAVFFGGMSYIGNGPNFMVKSIAEELGVKMPGFFGYMIKYSCVILLPVLFLVWLAFFVF